ARLAAQRPHLELGETGGEDGGAGILERRHGLVVAIGLDQRLGTRERRLDPSALVGGDAVREKLAVDAESFRQPLDRLPRRTRLAALDLADVLLRETLARELGLRHPGCDAQLPQALAQPEPG